MYRLVLSIALLLLLMPTLAGPAHADDPAPPPSPAVKRTLYERLGGLDALRLVVSDFYDRVQQDGDMRPMFIGMDIPAIKEHTVEYLMRVTGGPNIYHGRDLRSSHSRMKLTTEDWEHAVKILRESLAKYSVPDPEANELVHIVSGVRDQIVQGPSLDDRGDGSVR